MARILLLFVAALASAQVNFRPVTPYNGPTTVTVTPGTMSATAVTGLPYSGDRTSERILSDGTHMSQSMVREFRDSLGRRREEHSGQGVGSLNLVEILDPVAGVDWVLDPANQVAHRMVLQSKSRAASHVLMPCESEVGSQKIEGIEACGHRSTTAGTIFENWFSREEIGGVVLSRISNPQGDQSIDQLVNVRFSEPDPGLFLPPASYRVIEETAAFTITGPATEDPPAPASRTIVALTGMPWSGDLTSGSTLISAQSRDSKGRTRRGGNGNNVYIVDPVAGYSYTLDTIAQTAHRRNITVQSKPASEASAPARAASQTEKLADGVIAHNESLGAKTIDGVVTFGTRVTLTYPPGTMSGNDKTTTTVNEYWLSPQLGTYLVMQNSGALVPSFTSTLTNLKYSEPDPSLFRVPDGYRVIDDK